VWFANEITGYVAKIPMLLSRLIPIFTDRPSGVGELHTRISPYSVIDNNDNSDFLH
jgi:hypothetical protein